MKKGFTLVELSIVLVIIGLLIGGILVGQSLIESSRLAATVSQIQQFDAGTMAFRAKYKYLPGDAPAFGGDGDGMIDIGPVYAQNYVSTVACEHSNYWNSMMQNKFAKTVCNNSGNITTTGANQNVPTPKIGKSGSYFLTSALANAGSDQANSTSKQNYYFIVDPSQGKTITVSWYRSLLSDSTNSALKPAELMGLDNKLDDGVANAGNVLSGRINASYSIDSTSVPAACSTTTTYNLSNSGYECTPLIRIGSQAGQML